MNVRVSYEQKIIDALIALPRKRGEHCLDRFKREAAVMREILAPAYRAEADYHALVEALREIAHMLEYPSMASEARTVALRTLKAIAAEQGA